MYGEPQRPQSLIYPICGSNLTLTTKMMPWLETGSVRMAKCPKVFPFLMVYLILQLSPPFWSLSVALTRPTSARSWFSIAYMLYCGHRIGTTAQKTDQVNIKDCACFQLVSYHGRLEFGSVVVNVRDVNDGTTSGG